MDSRMLDPARAGAVMLFTTEPTDRALAGWNPPIRQALPGSDLAVYLTLTDDE